MGSPTQQATLPQAQAQVKDYARSKHTFRLTNADGNIFTVDKSALSLISPVFRANFEESADSDETLIIHSHAAGWKLLLDLLYESELETTTAIRSSTLEDALNICASYQMDVVKQHLLGYLMHAFKDHPKEVLRTLEVHDSALHSHLKILTQFKTKLLDIPIDFAHAFSDQASQQVVRPLSAIRPLPIKSTTPASNQADKVIPSKAVRPASSSQSIVLAIAAIMSKQNIPRCDHKKHSILQKGMGHNKWEKAVIWMRQQGVVASSTPIDMAKLLAQCKGNFGHLKGCQYCTDNIRAALNRVHATALSEGLL